jgi:multiple sugar transport system permease protein
MATTTFEPRATPRVALKAKSAERSELLGYAFIAPYFIVFVVFLLLPVLAALWISLQKWDIIGTPTWVGIANYQKALTDPQFWQYTRNTLVFTVLAVPVQAILGLAFALLVNNRRLKYMRDITRLALFAPYVVMVTAMGTLWRWILDNNFGVLNFYLGLIHLGPVQWLSDPTFAMLSVVIGNTWWLIGYGMVIYLAALQDIPEELYEAAKMDGGGSWNLFRFITLPAIRPATTFVIISSAVGALRVFGQPYMITSGGPHGTTQSIVMYIYLTGFQYFQMGYSSAISYLLFVITLIFTVVQLRLFQIGSDKEAA